MSFSAKIAPDGEVLAEETSLSNRFFFDPLIRFICLINTRPRVAHFVGRLLSPRSPGYLDEKHRHRFEPISDVSFRSIDLKGNYILRGRWMPHPQGSDRTIILAHGYTASWMGMLPTAQKFRDLGYNVFLFSFRGHDDSDGTKTTFGLREGYDVAAAVNFVKKTWPERSRQLLYLGHSMGAASVMLAPKSLKDHPDLLKTNADHYTDALDRLAHQLDGIILDSPYASLEHFITHHALTVANSKPVNRVLRWLWPDSHLNHLAERVRHVMHREADNLLELGVPVAAMQPAEVLKDSPLAEKPILLLHGTEDGITPYRHARRIVERLQEGGADVTLTTLHDAGHNNGAWKLFDTGKLYQAVLRNEDEYMAGVRNFLKKFEEPKPE